MFTKFCIRALLIVSCVFGVSNITAGVSDDTTVQTQEGPKPIRIFKIGDKILCSNMQNLSIEERAISAIEEVEAPRVIEITTSDNVTFYVAEDQKLFVTHKWVEAQQLTLEDVLMTKDRTFVKIVGIRHLEKPMTLRFIAVDEHHNFFAAENGVLIHNGPVTAAVGAAAVRVVGYGTVVAGSVIGVFVACTSGGPLAAAAAAAAREVAGIGGVPIVALSATGAVGETGAVITATATGGGVITSLITGTTTAAANIAGTIECAANGVSGILLALPTP